MGEDIPKTIRQNDGDEEVAKKRIGSIKRIFVLIVGTFLIGSAYANPVLNNVAAGNVSIQQSPGYTQVNQSSDKAIINWHSFNISAGERTHFQQPAGGIVLNRINPNQGASQIFGMLTATGKVILVNQAGIYFGPSAVVDVGGIIASTSDISDENFLAGRYIFDKPSPYSAGIVNEGTIRAAEHGLVALIGTGVDNRGNIQVNSGNVILASGNKFTVDFRGDGLVNFTVDEAATSEGISPKDGSRMRNGVQNKGSVIADGGRITMSAKAAASVLDHVINMEGVAQARSVHEESGEIILAGDEYNTVRVAGTLDAGGNTADAKGGKVTISSKQVLVDKGSKVDVSGEVGGGEIYIGGDYQGKAPLTIFSDKQTLANAKATVIMPETELRADAIKQGDGGKIIVWADDLTKAYGDFSARGGELSGNGGFVETSGKVYLDVAGIKVDTQAPYGTNGLWLLDPRNVTISGSATTGGSFSSGIFTPTADDAIVNVTDLTTNLASTAVTINTGSTGSQNGDITVSSAISWSSGNSLTLTANRTITVNADISNTGGASVTLRADNTGTGTGTVTFGAGNEVTLSGGSGVVRVYYNPTTFGTPDTIYTGGTTPIAYMLINQLGAAADTTTRSLASVSNTGAMWDKNFALAKDIDASATSGWNGGLGFIPIGVFGNSYRGNFDGQSYTISGLFVNRPATTYGGLFGLVGFTTTATIRNLGLINTTITAASNAGALAGQTTFVTTSGVYSINGTINAPTFVGGLIGAFSYTAGTPSILTDSYVIGGTVTASGASGNAGGLIGGVQAATNPSASVARTFSTASVTASAGTGIAGGLIGTNQAPVSNSYALGSVSGGSVTGGLVGVQSGATSPSISSSFAAGYVTGSGTGGLVGTLSTGTVTDSYWDTGTTGQSTSAAGTAQTTAQLQAALPSGFGSSWSIISGTSYPYLNTIFTSTPRVISGTSNASANTTTTVTMNGSALTAAALTQTTDKTKANGYYYFLEGSSIISDGSALLVYLPSGANAGSAVTLAPSSTGSVTGLTLNTNQVSVGDNNSNSISHATLQTAAGSLGVANTLYAVTGSAPNANLTLGSASNTSVTLASTANTAFSITGSIGLGAGASANSLSFSGPVTINNNNNTISSTGAQTYSGAVTLGSNASLSSSSQGITFGSTINGAQSLTVSASSNAIFGGVVGGSTPLTGFTVTSSATQLAGNVNTAGSAISINTPITLNGAVTLDATNGVAAGAGITIGAVTSGGNALVLNPGTNGAISASSFAGNGDLTITNANGATFTGAVSAGTLTISNFNPSATLAFQGNLNVGTGFTIPAVDFAIEITGSSNTIAGTTTFNNLNLLTLGDAAGDTLAFTGGVIATSPFAINLAGTLTAAGTGVINLNNAAITTMDTVTIGGTSTGAITLGPTIVAPDKTLTIGTGIANAINLSTIDGPGAGTTTTLVINTTGATVVGGAMGGLIPLNVVTITSGGGLTLRSVTTTGAQTFNNAVTLGADSTFTSSGGSGITFGSTVNGAQTLTVADGSGATVFGGAVGSGTALTSLTIGTGNATTLRSVTTTAGQSYGSAVMLAASTALTGSAITFDGTVNGAQALTLSGSVTFNNTAGASTAIASVNSSGSTTINGASIRTTNDQVYSGGLTLGADTMLTMTDSGSLTISNGLTASGMNLTLVGGSNGTTFSVGGTLAVNNVSVQGSAGTNSLTVNTSDSQSWAINGVNTGSVGSLSGVSSFAFSNIQNIVGGSSNNNTFTVTGSATLSSITGGSSVGTNRIDYASYQGPITIALTSNSSGTASYSGSTINTFSNINNVSANNQGTIELDPGKSDTIVITGAGTGYINDPIFFSGFNTFVGNSSDSISFAVPFSSNGANSVVVGGMTLFLSGGVQVVGTPTSDSTSASGTTSTSVSSVTSLAALDNQIISAVTAGNNPATASATIVTGLSAGVGQFIQATAFVNQTVDSILQRQVEIDRQVTQIKSVGCL